jgi:hypothetical protein
MTEKIPEFPKEIKGTQIHQIIWDEITEELKEQHNEQMIAVLIHPEVYKSMKYNRPMNVFEKLQAGWWWFGECFDEWCWTMTHDDGEFFNYLQSDYVKYEEDMYYE